MKALLSHPMGNVFVRQALQGLVEHDLLEEFWTAINWQPDSPLARLLPGSVRRQFERRVYEHVPLNRVRTRPLREVGRLFGPRVGLRHLSRHEAGPFCADAVLHALDRQVAHRLTQLPRVGAIYAYEDGALSSFQQAKRDGISTIYDLPIGYWKAARQIMTEEAELLPEWKPTIGGLRDSPAKLERKDAELRLSDVIVVASSFTASTLALSPATKTPTRLVPYGAPDPIRFDDRKPSASGKLRVLYVGSLGQRKGVAYALDAVAQLGNEVEFALVGRKPASSCPALDNGLMRHRWIESMPHHEVLSLMAEHDVLLFPSLFEGFGLVVLEAMSRGLPVITTSHTCGPDVIRDGVDGFIVPIRSVEAISDKLSQLSKSPPLLRDMQEAALANATQRSWANYRDSIADIVESTLPARTGGAT